MKKVKFTLKLVFVLLIGYLMFLPIFRASNYFFVREVKAIQHTLTEQREVAETVELTAVVDTVIATNKKIAKLRTYNEIIILKPYFCKEFKDLEFVK